MQHLGMSSMEDFRRRNRKSDT